MDDSSKSQPAPLLGGGNGQPKSKRELEADRKAAGGGRKPGRPIGPTKLTPEVQEKICDSLRRLGAPLKIAAAAAGIGESTLHHWREFGQAGQEPYASFGEAIALARAEGALHLIESALTGGKGAFGAQWVLERCFWQEFGARSKVEISGEIDVSVERREFIENLTRLSVEGPVRGFLQTLADSGRSGRGNPVLPEAAPKALSRGKASRNKAKRPRLGAEVHNPEAPQAGDND